MKKLIGIMLICALFFTCSFSSVASAQTTAANDGFSQSASDFVQNIVAGWNLGNTFENYVSGTPTVEEQEHGTYQPITQQGMIDKVATTGFNAIRIPVSWGPQTTFSNGNYTIKTAMFTRLKEVISWCYEHDMYVIVNMHHDDRNWLNISATNEDQWNAVKEQYRQSWQQIATQFKDYDEHLILEGGNEILATYSYDQCQNNSNYCWWGHAQESFDRQNELYQIFVDTVRATGGNNDKRYLMLPTYGAQWYENQVQRLVIPNDDKHIIMDIHWYNSSDQVNQTTRQNYAKMWQKYANIKGCGVVIGECGFNETVSSSTKISWANNFVKDLRQNFKIPVFLWDDGGNMKILNRNYAPYNWTSNSIGYAQAVVRNSKIEVVVPPIIYGDVNSDGEFGMLDLLMFKKYLFKTPGYIAKLPDEADVNNDDKFDVKDLLKMTRVQANLDRF